MDMKVIISLDKATKESIDNLTNAFINLAKVMASSHGATQATVIESPTITQIGASVEDVTSAITAGAATVATSVPETPPTSIPTVQTAPLTSGTVPTAAVTYTLDDLSRAAGGLMEQGKSQDLINLLNNTYGVQTLAVLPQEHYNNFAAEIRVMGAVI